MSTSSTPSANLVSGAGSKLGYNDSITSAGGSTGGVTPGMDGGGLVNGTGAA